MPIQIQIAIQGVLTILQGLSQAEMPNNIKIWVALAISVLQLVVGVIAHNYNPDGTPASKPYVK